MYSAIIATISTPVGRKKHRYNAVTANVPLIQSEPGSVARSKR